MSRKVHSFACFLLVLCLVASVHARPRFAIVIGSNHSQDLARQAKSYMDLHYADDDAIAVYQLLTAAGVDTILLTIADPDTLVRYGELQGASPAGPFKRSVLDAIDRQIKNAEQARDADIIFYFSGHGGNGALYLHDAAMTADDLRQSLLVASVKSGVHRVHLLIDACGRSSDDTKCSDPQAKCGAHEFAKRLHLNEYALAGIVYAVTEDGVSWELPEIQAGVLSYQLKSALWGAADVTSPRFKSDEPDHAISYKELAAYIHQANLGVANSRAKLHPFSDPPGDDMEEAILDWDAAETSDRFFAIEIPSGRELRLLIKRGDHRVLETNKGVGRLILRAPRDRQNYLAVELDGQGKSIVSRPIDPGYVPTIAYESLPTPKGANIGLDLQQGLFTLKFDASVVREYRPLRVPATGIYSLSEKGTPDGDGSQVGRNWMIAGTGVSAIAGYAVGSYFLFGARSNAIDDARSACGSSGGVIHCSNTTELDRANRALNRADRYRWAGIGCGVAGVALTAATVSLLLSATQKVNTNGQTPSASRGFHMDSSIGTSSAMLGLQGEF